MKKGFLSFLCISPLFISPLFGYTDPGSGALIWQLFMACGVGLLFYSRRFFAWIRGLFTKKSVHEEEALLTREAGFSANNTPPSPEKLAEKVNRAEEEP